jgi:hypothetical protein
VIGERNTLELDAAAQPAQVNRVRPVAHRRGGIQHIEELLQTRHLGMRSAILNQPGLVNRNTVDLNQRLAPLLGLLLAI